MRSEIKGWIIEDYDGEFSPWAFKDRPGLFDLSVSINAANCSEDLEISGIEDYSNYVFVPIEVVSWLIDAHKKYKEKKEEKP